jgi:hypothetical protein
MRQPPTIAAIPVSVRVPVLQGYSIRSPRVAAIVGRHHSISASVSSAVCVSSYIITRAVTAVIHAMLSAPVSFLEHRPRWYAAVTLLFTLEASPPRHSLIAAVH